MSPSDRKLRNFKYLYSFFFFQTTIKVFAKCLRSELEYKTLCINFQTTCREVVTSLLSKYRMRHRDPKLFFLTMEVTMRRSGKSKFLVYLFVTSSLRKYELISNAAFVRMWLLVKLTYLMLYFFVIYWK